MNEGWPWFDEQSGLFVYEKLFYGFGDSGSMAGYDYPTREDAIEYVKKEYEMTEDQIGTKPEQLGDCAVTVSSISAKAMKPLAASIL
jgi:hypothetical protein